MQEAAEALRLTAQDLYALRVADRLITEPTGGAQRDPQATIEAVGRAISRMLEEVADAAPEERRDIRRQKYLEMGSRALSG